MTAGAMIKSLSLIQQDAVYAINAFSESAIYRWA